MPLKIDIQLRNDSPNQATTTVFLAGSLDTATAPQLEQQLKPVLDGPTLDVVFDLEKLEFISSAGLRVFAASRKRLHERGGQASFIHLQPQIQKVFEIIAALPGMRVFSDTRELDNYLARRQLEVKQKRAGGAS
jgi:anti-sigma B factor antagonist